MRVKLKQIRKEYGMTQEQFADAIGISRSHYGQIETGYKTPSFPLVCQIKKRLNYPGDDIFDDVPDDIASGSVIE